MTAPRGAGDERVDRAEDETRLDIPVVAHDERVAEQRPPQFPSVGGPGPPYQAPAAPPVAAPDTPRIPAFASPDGGAGPALTEPVGGRNGRWRWIAAAVATIAVLALVGGFVVFFAPRAGTPSLVAEYAPAGTALYTELRLDLPGDQRDRLISFMSRFPGFADPATFQQKIDDTLDQAFRASGMGVDWKNDINPWFGGQVGIFASTIAPSVGTPPSMTFVFSVKNRQKLDEFVSARLAGSDMQQEDYKGQPIWTGSATEDSRRVSLAVTNEALIVSTRGDELKRALDVKSGEVNALADDTFFSQQLAALHSDRLAVIYYDYATLLDSMPALPAGLPEGCLDDVRNAANVKLLGEVRAETDHLALTMRSQIPTGGRLPAAPPNRHSVLLERMPAGTLAYIELRQVGAVVKSVIQQVFDCMPALPPGAEFDPRQLEQLLGVSLEDYFDFLDDAALGLTFADGKVGGGLIATVDDTSVASARVERLLGAVRVATLAGGVTVDEEDHGGVTITMIGFGGTLMPTGDEPRIGLAVTDGRLYLGMDDFVAAALDRVAADSLASSARLQAAVAAAGVENAGIVYIDVAGLRAVGEGLLPSEERVHYDSEIKPFVEPVTYLVVVNRTDAGMNVSNAFLYVE